MSLTLELPSPINAELTQASQREGISEKEHDALLVCLASAFKQEEPHTPFQKAVRVFLSYHSLDAERVVFAFEGLVQACLESNDAWKLEAPTGEGKTSAAFQFLKTVCVIPPALRGRSTVPVLFLDTETINLRS